MQCHKHSRLYPDSAAALVSRDEPQQVDPGQFITNETPRAYSTVNVMYKSCIMKTDLRDGKLQRLPTPNDHATCR
ncbi:hypothetical protein ElyMa_005880500 [Elysia marginata]|uniref:Uncharacterized protein n=1 Tax=Elysia marginata TaxID=1093978 RepID=A0AAV4G2D7_9GAST|nr:hypothetical protein ElyMa_005880500 [Elysia marginata]